jgi:hypothetical protein
MMLLDIEYNKALITLKTLMEIPRYTIPIIVKKTPEMRDFLIRIIL